MPLHTITSNARQPPISTEKFLQTLLETKDHQNSDTVNRLINSYSADLIHGVTRGKFITSKHFFLGLGLYNLTGQQKPIQIANHLGHCIDYKRRMLVCEIETAQPEVAQVMVNVSGILSVKPGTPDNTVLTYFRVDIFNMNIEIQTGYEAINSNQMIAFQVKSFSTDTPEQYFKI